jgi:3-oxoacyl-[acyl-carrier protein] reductase
MHDLKDKVVLVTGSSSGIGAAVAQAFAALGASVAVHFNAHHDGAESVLAGVRASGAEGALFGADLSDSAQCAKLIADVHRQFGRIDVLINNAGGFIRREALAIVSDERIEQVFNLNARSVMVCCRQAIPIMRAQGAGNIINVTSQAARTAGLAGSGLYAACKAFVSNYTRALAKELAADNIRVNAVAPGVIETPIHAQTPAETLRQLVASIPMQRLGTADECTGAFLYLASDELSAYVTGQIIEVNGGSVMP